MAFRDVNKVEPRWFVVAWHLNGKWQVIELCTGVRPMPVIAEFDTENEAREYAKALHESSAQSIGFAFDPPPASRPDPH